MSRVDSPQQAPRERPTRRRRRASRGSAVAIVPRNAVQLRGEQAVGLRRWAARRRTGTGSALAHADATPDTSPAQGGISDTTAKYEDSP
jgi:hypothetical protein